MNRSIRMLDDDSRFYLIFENPSQEDKKAAIEFVSSFYNKKKAEKDIQPETEKIKMPIPEEKKEEDPVKSEEPVPVIEKPENVMPVNVEPIHVPKKEEEKIPQIQNRKSFIQHYLNSTAYSETGRKKLYKNLKKYLEGYLATIDRDKIKHIKNFLTGFSPVLKNTIGKYLEENGYGNNLERFLETENLEKAQELYDLCKEKMLKGLSI